MRLSPAIVSLLWIGAAAGLGGGCGDDGDDGRLIADPAVAVGCLPPPAAGTTRAKRVDCADELVGGRLASGRLGDFVLANDRIRVIVRGPGAGYYLHGSSGGGLIDAAPTGGEDLIKEILPSIDLAGGGFDELVITEAGDDGPAELVVRGPATGLEIIVGALGSAPPPVIIEHHYRLAADADAVELETRIAPAPGAAAASHDLFDAMFMGGRAPAWVPGVGWADGSVSAELIATGGTTSSYALVYPAGAPDLQLIDVGGIRVVRGAAISAAPVRRWLVIGDGSVADVTGKAWALRGAALGTIAGTTAPGVDVAIRRGAAPITIARADASGHFRAAVPPGAYTARAEAIGRLTGADVAVTVTAGVEATATVPAGAGGTLALTVRDDHGVGLPTRVRLAQAGTGDRLTWTGGDGAATIALPPGAWRVTVSRGVEYDAFVAAAVTIADGQVTPVTATLERVVDTAGWISLDTHLHSELSTDSTFPIDDRVRAVAGEGVEVPVSSDHDVIADYAPIIAELGLGAWLGTLPGAEVSSVVWGHVNGFPLTPDPGRTGGGSPSWLRRAPGQVFAALRGDGSHLVQINHPRKDSNSLFDAIDLDPVTLTARRDPRDLDLPADADLSDLGFDAVEVANGGERGAFEEVFADWLALTAAGHPAAATGSSDSHGPTAFAGDARTFVWVGAGADDPATVDHAAIVDALRARHVVVATNAFVTAGIVSGATTSRPGDTVDVTGRPAVTLHVRVQAPPWQPLAAIRVYQGREPIRTITLDPADTAAIRYDADVTVPTPTADTFFVVRVDPAGPGAPVLGDTMPSFTNPLFATVTP